MMDVVALFVKTILLRPYVFLFLAAFLLTATWLLGWARTWRFWLISWATAFLCEYASTRTGVPFGWYHYNASTVGHELYIANIPFMDSISFSFLLFASYCVALCHVLPADRAPGRRGLARLRFDVAARTGWPALVLTAMFFAWIDMVIDPAALRGDRWFLGQIYYYPEPGVHFGVPLANYAGWAVVAVMSLCLYFPLDRRLPPVPALSPAAVTHRLLGGVGLYYGVLTFTLAVTFWIGEHLLGMTGTLMYVPLTALLLLRLFTGPVG